MSKKLILTAFIAIFGIFSITASSCMFVNGVDGNGNVVKETRDVSSFTAIDVGGAFEIFLARGDSESLEIEADENLLSIINTRVRNGVLYIDSDENIGRATELNLTITFRQLEKINMSGAVEIESKTPIEAGEFRLNGSGASEVSLELITDKLMCEFSGASEIELKGSADICIIEVSGASELRAYEFETREMDIEISGAGDANVFVTGELEARVSGAGSVRYKGDPKVTAKESGAGSIRKR